MRAISSAVVLSGISLLFALIPVFALPSTPEGCFSSSDPLQDQGPWTFQSLGYCQDKCTGLQKAVMAMKGANCWCGDEIPANSTKVADSKCNIKCNGFPSDICGGPSTWTVLLTGVDDSVGSFQEPDPSTTATPSQDSDSGSKPSSKQATTTPPATKAGASSTPDSTSNPPPSVIVTHASTVIVTAPGDLNVQQPSSTETKAKSSNTAGIAAGAVVGVVAACAIAGGLFFFLRNRKRRAIEEEFHRNSTNTLATNSNMSDARLEPSVMMQRRQSDGSIADNRDYSRRILKVTNPDGT
ncbi:hypothetical protein MMC22_004200 [Lobaria immixta]|nr:hypothetical protein [Lobaria immixta]